MKKFVVIYHAPASAMEQMGKATPEDMEKGMEFWMAWANGIGDGLVDIGSPLGKGQSISKDGNLPSESDITGYSVLQAQSMEEAKSMLQQHPHLQWAEGCKIEVFESMPLPK